MRQHADVLGIMTRITVRGLFGPASLSGVVSLILCLALTVMAPRGTAAQHVHSPGSEEERAAEASLGEPGNGAFAAVQEVLERLRADDDTDWSHVDLEALRQHLADMERFTREVVVLEQRTVEGGLRVVVRGTSPAASSSIRAAATAHAPMLEAERGWSAEARPADPGEHGEGATVLEVTAGSPEDVAEIRGLGYIGLMATGGHHTQHHWLIATGRAPGGH